MIKIKSNYLDNNINEIIIEGHSGYQESGKDIVCASVSSISITTINAILRLYENAITYEEKDGYLKIVVREHNEYVNTLIINMLDLFKELEMKYKKYIKIK